MNRSRLRKRQKRFRRICQEYFVEYDDPHKIVPISTNFRRNPKTNQARPNGQKKPSHATDPLRPTVHIRISI